MADNQDMSKVNQNLNKDTIDSNHNIDNNGNEANGKDEVNCKDEANVKDEIASEGNINQLSSGELDQYINCPLYPYTLPAVGNLVVITYIKLDPEVGVTVSLDEYPELTGMIYLAQLTRKRKIKSFAKLCPIGKTTVAEVIDVTDDYVDLSRRNITPEDEQKCYQSHNQTRRLHGLLKKLATRHRIPLKDLCQHLSWPVYQEQRDQNIDDEDSDDPSSMHPIESLKEKSHIPELELPDYIEKALMEDYDTLFGVEIFQLSVETKLISYGIEGLNDLKSELNWCLDLVNNSGEVKLEIVLDESPKYIFKFTGENKSQIEDYSDQCARHLQVFQNTGYYQYGKGNFKSFRE